MNDKYVYAAKNTRTGLFMSSLATPYRKYWQKPSFCREAITRYNNSHTDKLKMVKLELVEVDLDESEK